ncbi:hypothetical protein F5Y04DRAFT_113318 [Hypomontagnella monticulosa]|nr:hypothetical protein F5Y04DRAFT_113318 [Hypomontagnella monticulosa]
MLAKQILGAALFGSLAQAAFPTCVSSCVRQNGCPPTDMDCMCEKVGKTFLSDVVVCMNQWCSSETSLGDLVNPISAKCDVPQSAIQAAAAKAGFDTGDIASTPSEPSSSSKGGNSVSATMGVGSPTKVDSPTPEPTSSGSSSKGDSGDSTLSAVLSDTTAVLTQTPTASGTLLVAPSTFSSVPTSTPTTAANSEDDSSEESSNGTPGGSPADGAPAGNGATTREASMLAAVLAFGGAMAFGW